MEDKSKLVLTTIDGNGAEVPFGGGMPFATTMPKKSTVVCVTLDAHGVEIPIPAINDPDGPGAPGTPGTLWRQGEGPDFLWESSSDGGETWEASENTWKAEDGILAEPVELTPSGAGVLDLNNVLAALSAAGLITVDTATAQAELAKVTDIAVATVPNGTANTKAGVEAAMLILANALVAANYTVTIGAGSTYDDVTGEWEGVFVVTKTTTPLNTAADAAARTITITILAE
jgi:hypothetical protein